MIPELIFKSSTDQTSRQLTSKQKIRVMVDNLKLFRSKFESDVCDETFGSDVLTRTRPRSGRVSQQSKNEKLVHAIHSDPYLHDPM